VAFRGGRKYKNCLQGLNGLYLSVEVKGDKQVFAGKSEAEKYIYLHKADSDKEELRSGGCARSRSRRKRVSLSLDRKILRVGEET